MIDIFDDSLKKSLTNFISFNNLESFKQSFKIFILYIIYLNFQVIIGIKVETFNNIYLGLNLRLNRLLSNSSPNNFNNLYIPGFNKVTDDNSWGSGFNYTLTYSLPLRFNKKASIK